MAWWSSLISALPFAWAQYEFFQEGLLGIIFIASILAVLGTLVVNHQLSFFSEAVGHAGLASMALVVLLGRWPLGVMISFAILLAILIAWLKRQRFLPADSVVGLCLSFTVALGVVLLSRGGSFSKYSAYLTGDIFNITGSDIFVMAILSVVLLIGLRFYQRMLLVAFHQEMAAARGLKVFLWETSLMAVVAVAVTVAVPWMGILAVNALLIFPAAIARVLAKNLRSYLFLAWLIGLSTGILGLIISYYLDAAAGASIACLQAAVLFLALLGKAIYLRGRRPLRTL